MGFLFGDFFDIIKLSMRCNFGIDSFWQLKFLYFLKRGNMNNIIGFIRVQTEVGVSYGGDQNWFRAKGKKKLADYGCGMVSASDIILHMVKHRKITVREKFKQLHKVRRQAIINKDDYLKYLESMSKRFFPVFAWSKGTWGPALAVGFNVFAMLNRIQYRAKWGVSHSRLKSAIEEMIENDIPVLFSVGANFPLIWKKDGVMLYARSKNGDFHKHGTASRHYMTITGYFENESDSWIKVSSWGREFFVKWNEYEKFVKKISCTAFSNVLYIYHK